MLQDQQQQFLQELNTQHNFNMKNTQDYINAKDNTNAQEKERYSHQTSSLSRVTSAKNPLIESQNNTSTYQNNNLNPYLINDDNKDKINENSVIIQSKAKRPINIPRPKNAEQTTHKNDMKLNNQTKQMARNNQQIHIQDQQDSVKMNCQSQVNKRHSSFSKGRGKENHQQFNTIREEKKVNGSLSQQRRTTEISPDQHSKQDYHISTKYPLKESMLENNLNTFSRQKAVIAQNKENLEKNIIKLNYIRIAEKEKGVTIMRGLDSKQSNQINKIQEQTHFARQNNSINKQHQVQQKSVNPVRNISNTNSNIVKNISQDNQHIIDNTQIHSHQHKSHHSSLSDITYAFKNQSNLKTSSPSRRRGRNSKIIHNNSDSTNNERKEREESNYTDARQLDAQQSGSESNFNFSFSVALTDPNREKKQKDSIENYKAHSSTEEDEMTKKQWNKLYLDGNKIKNGPSNIEEEFNRIQKLSVKNELALQEFIAIRKQIIQIQQKNRIPSGLR